MDDAARRLKTDPTGEQRGSGKQQRKPEPRYLVIGQVVGAHGTRGELRVVILSDDRHRFDLLERVFMGLEDEEPAPYPLESHRLHKGMVLLKIRGLDDRSASEKLRGYLVQIPLKEAIALEEGEYYEHQILDLEVWTASDEYLGTVEEIIYTGANDVYVVRGPESPPRQILVPAIEEVILEIDLEAGRLVVQLPEGLL